MSLHFVTSGSMKSLFTYLYDNAVSKAEHEIVRKGSSAGDRKNSISQTTSSTPSEVVVVDNSDSTNNQFEFLNSDTRNKRNSDIAVRQTLVKARIV